MDGTSKIGTMGAGAASESAGKVARPPADGAPGTSFRSLYRSALNNASPLKPIVPPSPDPGKSPTAGRVEFQA